MYNTNGCAMSMVGPTATANLPVDLLLTIDHT